MYIDNESYEIGYKDGMKIFLLSTLILFIPLLLLSVYLGKCTIRQEAIDKGFAEYNSITSEWQWKESLVNKTNQKD